MPTKLLCTHRIRYNASYFSIIEEGRFSSSSDENIFYSQSLRQSRSCAFLYVRIGESLFPGIIRFVGKGWGGGVGGREEAGLENTYTENRRARTFNGRILPIGIILPTVWNAIQAGILKFEEHLRRTFVGILTEILRRRKIERSYFYVDDGTGAYSLASASG